MNAMEARRPRFDGVVFDCDGVLLDTQGAWTGAVRQLYRANGLRFDAQEEQQLLGASVAQIAATLANRLESPPALGRIERRLLRLLARRIGEPQAVSGARRLLEHTWRHQPTAVASNGPRALIEPALARTGFSRRLDAIVTADDVESPKPAPDVYVEACTRLDLAPHSTIAIEDSPRGVQAARTAGLFVVAIGPEGSTNGRADRVFGQLNDPRLIELVAGPL